MTWQLAAFALLIVALAAGFAWYERTRPDARIIALVGTLAAFAALGRMAFAAIPNVKPTSDIVLVSGFALGGAPGFVVGASAALTSNFFFGQGPWTPWQMVGWGLTGILGAALALLTRGRIGRWPLAIVCFAAGFAFTALQDLGDWVTYSDHSSAQLRVYLAKGLGFDLVHATGCFVFALAFGPALLRALRRFRARIAVSWLAPGSTLAPALLVALLLGASALGILARATEPPAALAAGDLPPVTAGPIHYLLAAQNPDGGLGSVRGAASSPLYSGWAALALAAAGYDPATLRVHGGHTLLTYLERTVGPHPDPGTLERSVLAVRAAGTAVTDVGGHDLLAALLHDVSRAGAVQQQTNLTAFAVLALRAARVRPSRRTIAWLARQQDPDGGFNFATAPGVSDVDDTASVLEALAATHSTRTTARAVAFIRAAQNRDGGFPSQPGSTSNAQSTAFGVQGLIAAGVSPATLHRHGARSPIAFLDSLIAPDGHVRYAARSDLTPVWVTAQALLALAGKALPIDPAAAAGR
jgi:energy-coupling factor transport system substrate-specific component